MPISVRRYSTLGGWVGKTWRLMGLTGAGLPPFLVEALVAFDIDAARGYHAINAPTVEELTGRAPKSVRAFVTEHRAALLAGH